MEEKFVEFNAYIEEGKAAMQHMIDELVRDERQDEARVYRASLNIYDIMATLVKTAKNKSKGDSEILKEEFHLLAARIPSSWKVSLEKAKEHEDFEKVMMEEAKLKVADEVIEKFDSIF